MLSHLTVLLCSLAAFDNRCILRGCAWQLVQSPVTLSVSNGQTRILPLHVYILWYGCCQHSTWMTELTVLDQLQERASKQLDKQTGLSTSEKDLMLRWNLYLHDHPCLSDGQMSQRCLEFAAMSAKDMLANSALRRCFMVHLINLWEFNLVPATVVDDCMLCIDSAQA